MHAFRSYDFQEIVCQRLHGSVEAALSYRRKTEVCDFSTVNI